VFACGISASRKWEGSKCEQEFRFAGYGSSSGDTCPSRNTTFLPGFGGRGEEDSHSLASKWFVIGKDRADLHSSVSAA